MPAPARKEPAPPSTTSRLDAARADHAVAAGKLNELETARAAALLADRDSEAANLALEIEQYRRLLRGFEDKIKLLQAEAEKEEQARRAKEREAEIARREKLIKQRDAALEAAANAVKQTASAVMRAIDLSREIISGEPWQPHDLPAALLTPSSIMTAIAHESYRVSYHARLYGGQDTNPNAGLMLPGSRCPRLELLENPRAIRAMADVVRDASEFARRFLRTGKSSSARSDNITTEPVPVINGGGEAVQRTDAERRLGELLRKQATLAEDASPQGEQEYQRVVREIADAQAVVTAEKQMESQHARG